MESSNANFESAFNTLNNVVTRYEKEVRDRKANSYEDSKIYSDDITNGLSSYLNRLIENLDPLISEMQSVLNRGLLPSYFNSILESFRELTTKLNEGLDTFTKIRDNIKKTSETVYNECNEEFNEYNTNYFELHDKITNAETGYIAKANHIRYVLIPSLDKKINQLNEEINDLENNFFSKIFNSGEIDSKKSERDKCIEERSSYLASHDKIVEWMSNDAHSMDVDTDMMIKLLKEVLLNVQKYSE